MTCFGEENFFLTYPTKFVGLPEIMMISHLLVLNNYVLTHCLCPGFCSLSLRISGQASEASRCFLCSLRGAFSRLPSSPCDSLGSVWLFTFLLLLLNLLADVSVGSLLSPGLLLSCIPLRFPRGWDRPRPPCLWRVFGTCPSKIHIVFRGSFSH